MAYSGRDKNTISEDPKVITAVEFLCDVCDKGHKWEDLRKYLMNRQYLTQAQVDEACRIYRKRIEKKQSSTCESQEVLKNKVQIDRSWQPGDPNRPKQRVNKGTIRGSADRPEISAKAETENGPFYLRADKRIAGKRLIKDFLRTEYNYIGVMECLQEEYYQELCTLADQMKVVFTRTELHEIFHRIPVLLDFHKVFYQNLKNPQNSIGHVFVRVFNFFKVYVEYMKDCTAMIIKMRKYIHDQKLQIILESIRGKSRRPNDYLVDLLLVPLDRIMDYKDFLDKLYEWADSSSGSHYVWMGKASRRIGRVATYIAKYKGGICNRNEMNKVQQFLSMQCNILSAKRRIIRRGLMVRRTTGWTARKKKYIFFLFSDLLLWTLRKGELQNVVRLRDCEVFPSDSKNNPEMKFKIISSRPGRHKKILLLECNLKRQRDQWYVAVEQAIKNAKESPENCNDEKLAEEDLTKYLSVTAPEPMFTTPPPGSNNTIEESKQENSRAESPEDDEEIPNSGPHHRYNRSENFPNSEFFEEFSQLDDTVSVTSEEAEPFSVFGQEYGDTMYKLFPNMVSSKKIKNKQDESREKLDTSNVKISRSLRAPTENGVYNIVRETNSFGGRSAYPEDKARIQRKYKETDLQISRRASMTSSSVIRRDKGNQLSNNENRKILERKSSFTIRLGNN